MVTTRRKTEEDAVMRAWKLEISSIRIKLRTLDGLWK